MSNPVGRTAVLMMLVFACGCGAGERAAEWHGTREVIEGVEVVRNPGAPLLAGLGVERLWEVAGEEALVGAGSTSSESLVWAEPTALVRGGERLYILDPMEGRVYALGTEDGRWIRTIGRKGGGPGELDGPRAVGVLDGVLVVLNGKRGSFDLFSPDGAYLRSLPTQGVTFSFQTLTSGRLLYNGMFARSDGRVDGGWRLYPLDGEPETIESWPTSVAVPGGEAEGSTLECMRTGAAGALIIRSSCAVPHLQLLDGEGRLLREFAVDRAPDLVTDAEREAEVEKVRETMSRDGIPPAMIQQMMKLTREESRIRKTFRMVREDPATGILALWEQNPSMLGGGPATLHLFSHSGIYLAELQFERAWVALDFASSTLFTLERDQETDLVRAAAYRIEVPEEFIRAEMSSAELSTEDV